MTYINQENEKIIEAWKEASIDLKIDIEISFLLQTDKGVIEYNLLIKNFGSKNGTLIITTDNMDKFDVAKKFGFYCSALNPRCYNKYDRENFIETLTDWGYFGMPENKPNWYTGHIYNENIN